MRDNSRKFKKTGWSWNPLKHWKRRFERDIRRLLA